MTIDERIEALTQSVELIASFHKDLEAKFGKMVDAMTTLAEVVGHHEKRIQDLEGQ